MFNGEVWVCRLPKNGDRATTQVVAQRRNFQMHDSTVYMLFEGNFDDDKWQQWYTSGVNLREIEFWLA